MVLQDREPLSLHKSVVFLLCLFAFSFQVWKQANFAFGKEKQGGGHVCFPLSSSGEWNAGGGLEEGRQRSLQEGKTGILRSTGSRSGQPASLCDTCWPL